MGWTAITKDKPYQILREDVDGRPVQQGDDGKLAVIIQEDFGHSVAVDLLNGIIALDFTGWNLDPDQGFGMENARSFLWICDDTNITAEYRHNNRKLEIFKDENGKRVKGEDGEWVRVRTDYLESLIWRPIWFTRWTNGVPTKVIGAQTTTPKEMGKRNVKRMVMLYADGRMGIA